MQNQLPQPRDALTPSELRIINFTPDSSSQAARLLPPKEELQWVRDEGVGHIDIGAQSTRPGNTPISWREEVGRLEVIYPHDLLGFKVVSFDTYHLETISELRERFCGSYEFWWNDVSGVINSEMLAVLSNLKPLKYILTYTQVPQRDETFNHLKYQKKFDSGDRLIQDMYHFFQSNIEKLCRYLNESEIILDPGFGFSKSLEQNLYLWENLDSTLHLFPNSTWLLGVSRKGFWRHHCQLMHLPEREQFFIADQRLHSFIANWRANSLLAQRVIFRLHTSSLNHNNLL